MIGMEEQGWEIERTSPYDSPTCGRMNDAIR